MKFTILFTSLATAGAFSVNKPTTFRCSSTTTSLSANIRGPTEKAQELRFGWDGTTALGGAVEVAKPSRILEDIRAAGEEIPSDCEVFNANLEMDGSDVMFEEVIEVSHAHYLFPPSFVYHALMFLTSFLTPIDTMRLKYLAH